MTSSEEQRASRDLLTVAEVARILRWHEMTIRRHITSGLIPAWAVVTLPHRGKRTSYRLKRTWLVRLLAGKETDLPMPVAR